MASGGARRGHGKTDTDAVSHGAWLRGRIYEDKCDLSPDGQLFVYAAFKGARSKISYTDSWTAVSRPPWLHALVFWPMGTTYGGGGRFVDNRRLVLRGAGRVHPDYSLRGIEIVPGAAAYQRSSGKVDGAEWSGRDHRNRLVFASSGRIFARTGGRDVAGNKLRALLDVLAVRPHRPVRLVPGLHRGAVELHGNAVLHGLLAVLLVDLRRDDLPGVHAGDGPGVLQRHALPLLRLDEHELQLPDLVSGRGLHVGRVGRRRHVLGDPGGVHHVHVLGDVHERVLLDERNHHVHGHGDAVQRARDAGDLPAAVGLHLAVALGGRPRLGLTVGGLWLAAGGPRPGPTARKSVRWSLATAG